MPPTHRRPSDDELLDGARDVFAEHGYQAASMAEIARRASTTKPTLYAHFGSKEAMYSLVFQREAEAIQNHLFAVYENLPEGDVEGWVKTALDAGMSYVADNPTSFRVLVGTSEAGTPAAAAMRSMLDSFIDRIAQIVDDAVRRRGAIPALPTRTVAAMAVASGLEAARQGILVDGLSPAHAAELATAYIAGGIAAIETRLVTQ
ncbi:MULTISPECIES: TetR/AcrR family transcriptional regulator [unclassified Mycobacterium]|uniref:TetR/AcrR family transcriptional regulator n=1 Tax=unclassified Mycobacterium TaxID=2642494 RepID=UPI00099277C9|nr:MULTISPECIES: TetR/AcrR family transcriptional regulator [unclassified Mycobacterium]